MISFLNFTNASNVSIFPSKRESLLKIFLEKKNEIIPTGNEIRIIVNNIHIHTDILSITMCKTNKYYT